MTPLLRRFMWWLQRRRKEDEMREELRFHLDQEMQGAATPDFPTTKRNGPLDAISATTRS